MGRGGAVEAQKGVGGRNSHKNLEFLDYTATLERPIFSPPQRRHTTGVVIATPVVEFAHVIAAPVSDATDIKLLDIMEKWLADSAPC